MRSNMVLSKAKGARSISNRARRSKDELSLERAWRPAVTVPRHRGFGSRLIESLGRELAGSTNILFEPGGLIYTIDAPVNTTPSR
jgi:hypothetical protein